MEERFYIRIEDRGEGNKPYHVIIDRHNGSTVALVHEAPEARGLRTHLNMWCPSNQSAWEYLLSILKEPSGTSPTRGQSSRCSCYDPTRTGPTAS